MTNNSIFCVESTDYRDLANVSVFLGVDYDTLNLPKIQASFAIFNTHDNSPMCVIVVINKRFMICVGNGSGWMPLDTPKYQHFRASLHNRLDLASMIYDHSIHSFFATIEKIGVDLRAPQDDNPMPAPIAALMPVIKPMVVTQHRAPQPEPTWDDIVDEIKNYDSGSLRRVNPTSPRSPPPRANHKKAPTSQLRPQATPFVSIPRQSSPDGICNRRNDFFSDMRSMKGSLPSRDAHADNQHTPVGSSSRKPISAGTPAQNKWSLD